MFFRFCFFWDATLWWKCASNIKRRSDVVRPAPPSKTTRRVRSKNRADKTQALALVLYGEGECLLSHRPRFPCALLPPPDNPAHPHKHTRPHTHTHTHPHTHAFAKRRTKTTKSERESAQPLNAAGSKTASKPCRRLTDCVLVPFPVQCTSPCARPRQAVGGGVDAPAPLPRPLPWGGLEDRVHPQDHLCRLCR